MSSYCDFLEHDHQCSRNFSGFGACIVWQGKCPYEHERQKALKNRKTIKLDKYINLMKKEYPQFEYANILNTKNNKFNLGKNTFAIVVEKIPKGCIKKFLNFVDNKILMPLIKNNKELPLIITLQNFTSLGD
jgi:hypothetical protein